MTNVHDFFETNYKFFNRTLSQNPHVVQGSTFFFFFWCTLDISYAPIHYVTSLKRGFYLNLLATTENI